MSEDLILVPRRYVASACHALANGKTAMNTLEGLRKYSLGASVDANAQSQLAALREELAKTYRSASELANAMTRDVPDLSPEFELFDYTCGVIGQIDNMYAGMRAERNALQQRLADAERRNAVRDAQLSKAIDFVERLCASAGNQPSIATGYLRDILDALNPNPEAASHDE